MIIIILFNDIMSSKAIKILTKKQLRIDYGIIIKKILDGKTRVMYGVKESDPNEGLGLSRVKIKYKDQYYLLKHHSNYKSMGTCENISSTNSIPNHSNSLYCNANYYDEI